MDVRKTLLVAFLVAALLVGGLVRPPVAAAADAATTGLIVGSAVAGAVALITLIAIIGADREDPELMPLIARAVQPQRWDGRPRWAPDCRPDGPRLSLVCW